MMRLIDTSTSEIHDFPGKFNEPYAILSHRWGSEEDELSYKDYRKKLKRDKSGYKKICNFRKTASEGGQKWAWVDTCCIDKNSSAELIEAINSMFEWYRNAKKCYVYLHDIEITSTPPSTYFLCSEWKRGWTLQELLAPQHVEFYDCKWTKLGTKEEFADQISTATGIPPDALRKSNKIWSYSVAQRMSWASQRETTRPEDHAYCLLGIFDVLLTPVYGEGLTKAFRRLQEEIMKRDDDQSIFAWPMDSKNSFSGLLAAKPKCFRKCSMTKDRRSLEGREPFQITNRGLCISLEITPWNSDTYLAFLHSEARSPASSDARRVCIFLRRLTEDDQYVRVSGDRESGLLLDRGLHLDCINELHDRPMVKRELFIRNVPDARTNGSEPERRICGYRIPRTWVQDTRPEATMTVDIPFPDAPWELKLFNFREVLAFDDGRWEFAQFALGFDIDLNPVCLLAESTMRTREVLLANKFDCLELEEGGRAYCGSEHDGLWRLRGDRRYGLDAMLLRSFDCPGPIVGLTHVENSWDFSIQW